MATKFLVTPVTPSQTLNATVTVDVSTAFSAAEPLRGVLLLAVGASAPSSSPAEGNALMAMGLASNDGGSIQQLYNTAIELDGATAQSDGYTDQGTSTGKVLQFLSGQTTITGDLSISAWTDTSFTVTTTTALAAAQRVIAICMGGSSITAFRTIYANIAAAVASQDISSASPITTSNPFTPGWGLADVLMALGVQNTVQAPTASSPRFGFNIGKAGGQGGTSTLTTVNGGTSSDVWAHQVAKALIQGTNGAGFGFAADIDGVGPASGDGVKLNYSSQATAARPMLGAAMRGSYQFTLIRGNAPTSAGALVQDVDVGFVPKGAIMFGNGLATNAGGVSTHAQLGIGAWDGTSQASVGVCMRDAVSTRSTGRYHTESAIHMLLGTVTSGAPTKRAEAVVSNPSGTIFRLTWSAADATGSDYFVAVFGDAAAATPVRRPRRVIRAQAVQRAATW